MISEQHCVGQNFGFSPNDLKCDLQRLFNIFFTQKAPIYEVELFEFVSVCPEGLTLPSSVGDPNSCHCFQCNLLGPCLIISLLFVVIVFKCSGRFCKFLFNCPVEQVGTRDVGIWISRWIYIFCSWLFHYTRGWIETRTLQCSNCSDIVFPFSGTLDSFGTRIILEWISPVKRLVFVCLRSAFGTWCCRSYCFVRSTRLWASKVLFHRLLR